MPYNTSAIPPRKEPTGQTQLPRELHELSILSTLLIRIENKTVSRVKKIISQDPEIQMCSNNAAFVVTLAAVRHPGPC